MHSQKKICLITGITSGIGKAAAERFAFTGSELILVARNRVRGERVVNEIVTASGNDKIKLFTADLSSFNEIKDLSTHIHSDYGVIDVLVNCAGAYFSKFHHTIDGVEASFAVNYLSRFLLINLILDLLLNSPSARIINITGESHRRGKPDFTPLSENNYSPVQAGSQAKLADMLFVMELAGRLKKYNITVNAMHPGAVSTNIVYNDPDATILNNILYSIIKPFFKSAGKASENIYYLAFAEDLKGVTGKYFNGKKPIEPSEVVFNKELASSLWEQSQTLTGLSNTFFNNKTILEK